MEIIYMRSQYFAIPYKFGSVTLWAVEDESGYIECYCNSKSEAEEAIKELIDGIFRS